jgi:hypothetical protein
MAQQDSTPKQAEQPELENVVELSQVDPFDPSNFAAPPDMELTAATRLLVQCKVGTPSKDVFVRAHHDPAMSLEAFVLKLDSTGETYLLTQNAAEGILSEVRRVVLTVAVDRQLNPFLWLTHPVPTDGKDNSYWSTSRTAKEMAKKRWIRMRSNQAARCYDIFEAKISIAEPQWPEYTMPEYLRAGFGEGFTISDPYDPVIQRLLGLA